MRATGRKGMTFVAIRGLALITAALACSIATSQVAPVARAGRPGATRAELDGLVTRAAELAGSPSLNAEARGEKEREVAALRHRLTDGDFEVGDQLILSIQGDSALSDTFAVQPGRTLNLPNLPEVSLVGVLRSELRSHLMTKIARFVKDTTLRATALVRVGVLGEVANPGYFHLRADIPISDAIMAAGGPTARADLTRTIVRRGSTQLLSKDDVRAAMVDGRTLDELDLSAGDEFVIRPKREWGWQTVAQIAAVASGILLSLRAF